MYLRDLAVYADNQLAKRYQDGFVGWFHVHTCCIVEFFLTLITRKVQTSDVAKVTLILCSPEDVPTKPDLPLHFSNVRWPFDFERYRASTEHDKRALILSTVHDALVWIAKTQGWNVKPFNEAAKLIEESNLTFEGLSKKSWRTPDGRRRVKVHFKFELERVVFHAVLLAGKTPKELDRVYLGDGVPESDCLRAYIGNGEWVSPTTFQLTTAGFISETWQADFASSQP